MPVIAGNLWSPRSCLNSSLTAGQMNHMPAARHERGERRDRRAPRGERGATSRPLLARARAERRTKHSERDAPQEAEVAELGRERLGGLHRDRPRLLQGDERQAKHGRDDGKPVRAEQVSRRPREVDGSEACASGIHGACVLWASRSFFLLSPPRR